MVWWSTACGEGWTQACLVKRKVHVEGPRRGRVNVSRPGLRDPRGPDGVMGGPHGARKSKST